MGVEANKEAAKDFLKSIHFSTKRCLVCNKKEFERTDVVSFGAMGMFNLAVQMAFHVYGDKREGTESDLPIGPPIGAELALELQKQKEKIKIKCQERSKN